MTHLIPTAEQVFDQTSFYPAFVRDLGIARGTVLIQSPFVSVRRIERLAQTLSLCVTRGVRICAFLQEPVGWAERETQPRLRAVQGAIELLESLGVHVNLRTRVHQKLVVIDECILYTGSLNVLSHFDTEEEMRRYFCRERTREAVARCRLDRCERCITAGNVLGKDATVDNKLSYLGMRLAARREALRWSQRELAARSGIPQNIISEIERGKRIGRVDTLIRLCSALETELLIAPRHLLPAVNGLIHTK